MKRLYFLIPVLLILFSSCYKRDYYRDDYRTDADWMRMHDHGTVAYVDYSNGNYIVDMPSGFAVVEYYGGVSPQQYDDVYAYFTSRGVQTVFNYSIGHYGQGRVVDSWLSWSDAMYLIDQLNYGGY